MKHCSFQQSYSCSGEEGKQKNLHTSQ